MATIVSGTDWRRHLKTESPPTGTFNYNTNGTTKNKEGLRHSAIHLQAVTSLDAVVTGIQGIQCIAWQANNISTSALGYVSDAPTGEITIVHINGGTVQGWLHVWSTD